MLFTKAVPCLPSYLHWHFRYWLACNLVTRARSDETAQQVRESLKADLSKALQVGVVPLT